MDMETLLKDKDFFISRRGDEYLVYAARSLKAVLLSDIEYAVFRSLIDERSAAHRTVLSGMADVLSSAMNLNASEISVWLEAFRKKMIALQILPKDENDPRFDWLTRYPEKNFELQSLYLHLTDRCNLHCRYCYNAEYRQESGAQPRKELTDAEVFDVIDQAVVLGVKSFTISGGEPLLRPSCLEIGQYIRKKKGCFAELLTNGTLLDRVDSDTLFDSYDQVVVSLDSHHADINDMMRGQGTYRMIYDNVKSLCARHPSRIALRPVVHKRNISELEQFIRFAVSEFGIRNVRFSLLTPRVSNEPLVSMLCVGKEEYVQLLSVHSRILDEMDMGVQPEDLCVDKGCGAGGSLLSIGASGEVFPCQAMHSEAFLAGNIRDDSLQEIGESSSILKAMRSIRPTMIEGCKDCSLVSICGGGCRANAADSREGLYQRNEQQCPIDESKCEYLLWKNMDSEKERLHTV